jgi:hypothetical protein
MFLSALVSTATASKLRMDAANGVEGSMAFDGTNMVFSNVQEVLVGGVALAKSGAGVSATDFSDLSKTVTDLSKTATDLSQTVDGLSERLLSIETTSQELCIAPPNAVLISSGRRDSKQHGVTGFCK